MKRIILTCLIILSLMHSAYALNAPIISSPTHPSESTWYRSNKIALQWSTVQDAKGYSYVLDQRPSTILDAFAETTETSISIPAKMDGAWYFHIAAVSGVNIGPSSTFKLKIDRTPPTTPTNLIATPQPNGHIELNWDASTDAYSGIAGYKIYRKKEKDFDIRYSDQLAELHPDNSYTDTDISLLQGYAYFYKVAAVDQAGNHGPVSIQAFAVTPKRCDIAITLNVPKTITSSSLSVSATSDKPMQDAQFKLYPPGKTNPVTFASKKDNVTTLSQTIDISPYSDGELTITLTAKDRILGDPCEVSRKIILDRKKPKVQITAPAQNESICGEFKVVAEIDDGQSTSGITSGTIYYKATNWQTLCSPTPSNTKISCDWKTKALLDGTYLLKAEVQDAAGNISESEVSQFNVQCKSITPGINGGPVSGPTTSHSQDQTAIIILLATTATVFAAAFFFSGSLLKKLKEMNPALYQKLKSKIKQKKQKTRPTRKPSPAKKMHSFKAKAPSSLKEKPRPKIIDKQKEEMDAILADLKSQLKDS